MGTKTQGTKDEEKHSTICVGHQYAQTQKTQIKHEPSYKQREVNMNRTSHLCGNRDKLTTYIYIKIIIIYRRCGGSF